MKSRSVITVLVSALMTISMGTVVCAGSADTVALNGKVYTMNPKQPWAQAVVVKGDTIVYVGDGAVAESNAMGWLSRFFVSALFPF